MAIKIGDELQSIATNGRVARTKGIYDEASGKTQDVINEELYGKYSKPEGGIPSEDLDQSVFESIGGNANLAKESADQAKDSEEKAAQSYTEILSKLEEVASQGEAAAIASEVAARKAEDARIDGEVNDLAQKVDKINGELNGTSLPQIKAEDVLNKYLNSSLKWSSGNASFIIDGRNAIGAKITTTGVIQYAFLKSNDSTLNNIAEAYDGRLNGNIVSQSIPADYPYIYLYVGSSLTTLPTITIEGGTSGIKDDVEALKTNVNKLKDDVPAIKETVDGIVDKKGVDWSEKSQDQATLLGTQGFINYSDYRWNTGTDAPKYHTYVFVPTQDTDFYVETIKNTTQWYLSVSVYKEGTNIETDISGTTAAGNAHIDGLIARDRTADNNLPTADKPWNIEAGQVIAISVRDADFLTGFKFFIKEAQTVLNNNIQFGTAHIEKIKEIAKKEHPVSSDTCYASYLANSDTRTDGYGKEQINLFIPTKVGFVKYAFVHCVCDTTNVTNNKRNADNWRIDRAIACDDDKNYRYPITADGEWEMALHKLYVDSSNVDDFIGGIAHGDEVVESVNFYIDGHKINGLTNLNDTPFNEFRIVEVTNLYDPDDLATLATKDNFTPFAKHGKEYIFTKDGVRLKQSLLMLKDMSFGNSYYTMLPIIRVVRTQDTGDASLVGKRITDTFYADDDYLEYDASTESSSALGKFRDNVNRAVIWSNDCDVSASVDIIKHPNLMTDAIVGDGGAITKLPEPIKKTNNFQVQNSVAYNKFYWSLCAGGEGKGGGTGAKYAYHAKSGERFDFETLFRIEVSK